MSNYFYQQVAKARSEILHHPRKCEICGTTESVCNVMLKYDNGKIMCDDCAIEFYSKEETEEKNGGLITNEKGS